MREQLSMNSKMILVMLKRARVYLCSEEPYIDNIHLWYLAEAYRLLCGVQQSQPRLRWKDPDGDKCVLKPSEGDISLNYYGYEYSVNSCHGVQILIRTRSISFNAKFVL